MTMLFRYDSILFVKKSELSKYYIATTSKVERSVYARGGGLRGGVFISHYYYFRRPFVISL